jgi:hypothetical protein
MTCHDTPRNSAGKVFLEYLKKAGKALLLIKLSIEMSTEENQWK